MPYYPGVPTIINLNDTVPTAPAGKQNVKWQADTNVPRNVSAYINKQLRIATFIIDNPTPLTVSNKLVVPADWSGNCVECYAIPNSAPSVDTVVDILDGGTTIFAGSPGPPKILAGSSALVTVTTFLSNPQFIAALDILQAKVISGDTVTVVTLVLVWIPIP